MRKDSKLALGVIGLSTLGTSYLLGQHGEAIATIAMAPAVALDSTQATTQPEPPAESTAQPAEQTPSATPSDTSSTTPTQEPQAQTPAPSASEAPAQTQAPEPTGVSGNFRSDAINYRYGTIQLELVVQNDAITNINLIQASTKGREYAQAPAILVQAALDAQGSGFGNLSGATFTTKAFKQALDSALSKAGM